MVCSIYISYVSVQFYLLIEALWEAVRNKMDPHFCQHLAYLYLDHSLRRWKYQCWRQSCLKIHMLWALCFLLAVEMGEYHNHCSNKRINEVSTTVFFCSFVSASTSCWKETATWLTLSLQEKIPFYPVVKKSCFMKTQFSSIL